MKLSIRIVFVFLISFLTLTSAAQSLASGLQVFDEVSRKSQLYSNSDSLISYCVRPLYSPNRRIFNTYSGRVDTNAALSASTEIVLLPVILRQQYNTHRPYGWNDGSMIPAKGYQNQFSFGVFLKKGIVSLQLRPEIVYAQNSTFPGFSAQHSDSIWRSYYSTVLNEIDAPERFGQGHYLKMFPGQSSFRINYKKLSLGASTENLWWGPGVRNSLLMTNNAPGFPHLSFNSTQPINSSIGSFEWQLISGRLKGSGILPEDTSRKFDGQPLYVPRPEGDRYINGVVFTWQPKWTKGLFVGFSRTFYQYLSDVPATLNGYLPVIGKFFKRSLATEDEKKRDQMFSLFFRLMLLNEKAEFYGEFGRNDHSYDIRDLLDEPEHSRAYVFGFSKIFERSKTDLELFGEITNLQMPATIRLRAQESWYTHYQVRHGYTHKGQVIGAGIGPGGSSQIIGLQWGSGLSKYGGTIERVVHNNDFYYDAFTPLQQWKMHWVDLSLNFNKSWLKNRLLYDLRLSTIYSLNHKWYRDDIFHLNMRVAVAYLF